MSCPFGDNLLTIVERDEDLHREVADYFREYGFDFFPVAEEERFEIQKVVKGLATKYAYSTVADTLQRMVFYLAAIESNKDSVLIFEEPETHSFPPYTRELASRIELDVDNQYFITTHSPVLAQYLIESLKEADLFVNLVYFEDYCTKVKQLDEGEVQALFDMGLDMFFYLKDLNPKG